MPTRPTRVLEWLKDRAAADAPMQAAARARDAAPGEPDEDDTDILSVLTRQHDQVTALLRQVKAIPGVAKGGSPSHQAERASIIGAVTVALSRHEAAEEQQFWPWVRSVLDDGDDLAQTAFGQEQEGRDLLAALRKADASDERFDELAEELDKACRKHVAFEDRVLLRLRGAASQQDREAAGSRFLRVWRDTAAWPSPNGDHRGSSAVVAGATVDGGREKAGRPVKRRGRAGRESDDRTADDKTEDRLE